MAISSKRFDTVYSSLPTTVQKTYTAVPSSEQWSHSTIHMELIRTGMARDVNNTRGCLAHLVRAGLVSEPTRGYFCRVPVRGKVTGIVVDDIETADTTTTTTTTTESTDTTDETTEVEMATPSTLSIVPTKAPPIDQLAKIAQRAMVISGQLKELANDIEAAALDVTEQIASADKGTAKLKQLQELLKGLV